jgi:hypothetical protein
MALHDQKVQPSLINKDFTKFTKTINCVQHSCILEPRRARLVLAISLTLVTRFNIVLPRKKVSFMYPQKTSLFRLGVLAAPAVLASSVFLSLGTAPASAADVTLGETSVSPFFTSKEVVKVNTCEPRVARLRLQAKNANVNIKTLVINFKNGTTQNLALNTNLKSGGQSQWIDLPGDKARCIDRIGITGTAGFSLSPARVIFVGQTLPTETQARLLGEARIVPLSNDKEVIRVTSCQPRVTSLQLRAKNADANLDRVVVTFGNGEKQELSVRSTLPKDQMTRWIALDGKGGRCVTQVRIVGSVDFNFNLSPARILVFGR